MILRLFSWSSAFVLLFTLFYYYSMKYIFINIFKSVRSTCVEDFYSYIDIKKNDELVNLWQDDSDAEWCQSLY